MSAYGIRLTVIDNGLRGGSFFGGRKVCGRNIGPSLRARRSVALAGRLAAILPRRDPPDRRAGRRRGKHQCQDQTMHGSIIPGYLESNSVRKDIEIRGTGTVISDR